MYNGTTGKKDLMRLYRDVGTIKGWRGGDERAPRGPLQTYNYVLTCQ
jgi:hypothetical protein